MENITSVWLKGPWESSFFNNFKKLFLARFFYWNFLLNLSDGAHLTQVGIFQLALFQNYMSKVSFSVFFENN